MKDRVWEVDYQGHTIRATNTFSISPLYTSEALEIDGKQIDCDDGLSRLYSNLMANCTINGKQRLIEVCLGQNLHRFSVGAKIYVDNIQIGGDKSVLCWSSKEAANHKKNGFLRFFLLRGLLVFGIPFAVMGWLVTPKELIHIQWLVFPLSAVLFGLLISKLGWQNISKAAERRDRLVESGFKP
jgi:hypothetical protein